MWRCIDVKNTIKIIAVIMSMCVTFLVLLLICFTSWENAKINSLNIYYNKVTKSCIAGNFEWDGNNENMIFTVPDEYDGIKIKSLGGVVGKGAPVLFCVKIPESLHQDAVYSTESEECVGVINEDTVTYNFTVKLGKNIRNFEKFTYKEYFMDANDNVVYIVEIKYECTTENEWSYAEDGKLYDKNTDQLIH